MGLGIGLRRAGFSRMGMKNLPSKRHERFLYIVVSRPGEIQSKTNGIPVHTPQIARKISREKSRRSRRQPMAQVGGCRCSQDRSGGSFLKMATGIMRAPADCRAGMLRHRPDKWEGRGDQGLKKKWQRRKGKFDRSSLVAFYLVCTKAESRINEQSPKKTKGGNQIKNPQDDKREGGCSIKGIKIAI